LEWRGRLDELAGDSAPEPFGGGRSRIGQEAGDLPVIGDFGPAAGASGQVPLDPFGLLGAYSVEGVCAQQLLDFGGRV
jgi:hypothetical protein